jgi:hypothetical protein
VFGDLEVLDAIKLGGLGAFRARGGAVLWASERHNPRRSLGIHTDGSHIVADGASIYQGWWKECPVVSAWTDRQHPLFKGLTKGLATNRPSFLRPTSPDLMLLARFSPDCRFRFQRGLDPPDDMGYIAGSPKDQAPPGRAVALAGQGVFLNGMLIQPDNDNFAFAWNTIRWLSEGPREHALFMDEGTVVEQFALPLSKFDGFPVPPLSVINRMIRGLEDENIFNRLLQDYKEPILRGLLLIASAALVLMGAWRLLHGRFRVDAGLPIVVGKDVSPAAVAASVLVQRQDELRRRGNLWEPAQVLVREFFREHTGTTLPLWDALEHNAPAVVVDGTFWQRRRLTRQVRRLWKLAGSSPAEPVSPARFDETLKTIAELNAALGEGRLRLGGGPVTR